MLSTVTKKVHVMEKYTLLYSILKRVAIVALFFSLLVASIILINYFQLQKIDPAENSSLKILKNRIDEEDKKDQNPANRILKEDYRLFQLLIRKAFLTARWQINTGALILIVSVIVLAACLTIMNTIKKKYTLPDKSLINKYWQARGLARILFFSFSLLFIAVLSVVVILSNNAYEFTTPAKEDTGGEVTITDRDRPDIGVDTETTAGQDMPENTDNNETLQDPGNPDDDMAQIKVYWPNFRGPFGQGKSYSEAVPTDWNGETGKNIIWKQKLGKPGLNSPVVWGNVLFLTGADEREEAVFCYDTDSGEVVWESVLSGIKDSPPVSPETSPDTGLAAPSMATDGKYAFALFATGNIAAFDFKGNLIWAKNLGVPDNIYGHSSSLLVFKDLLLIQYDHREEAKLIALETGTGTMRWQTSRDVLTSWASPILIKNESAFEIVLSANPYVLSYDPGTGKQLWQVECLMGEVGPSPAFSSHLVFATSQFGSISAIDIKTREIVWENYDDLPSASSPLATDDYVYTAADYGVVTCYSIADGEIKWIHEFEDGFYSSPVASHGLIYLMDREGGMQIFKDSEEFEIVAQPELGEKSDSTPALAHGRIYIRGKEHLFCIGNKDE